MIDTHAHLDACEPPLAELLARSRAAGVQRVITIGTGIDSSRAAVELADREDGVYAAVGIDPHQAGTIEATRVGELAGLLGHPSVVAIGEAGLDAHHARGTLPEQHALFEAQLALADEHDLPIVVHCRKTAQETAAVLASYSGAVVLHCFSEPELLGPAVDHGWYVSFAGNVTYPKAGPLRETAARIPVDRILAETDSPYLSPQPMRGRRNEPAYLVHTLAVLARARGDDVDELGRAVEDNASRVFGLSA